MYTLPSTVLFATLAVVGFILLIKSITRLMDIYATAPKVEWIAQSPACYFDLRDPGIYEISVMRPSIFGVIPKQIPFEVLDRQAEKSIAVENYNFLLSGRRDMSGNRIVPIAEFTIDQPSTFRLFNPANDDFNQTDKLLIRPKAGITGVLSILGVVFSGVLFIGGSIVFIITLVKP
ncbi:hypothetical protein [Spirosoma endbachense]|uniref:Uncharacterized protein n=1 Tax=Spirosoma endbachense TaxID=2666025 RepID=A0A6P1VX31_9BACT|nr:hypothetical protein [Spirosoma endbachense]QHV96938.1 hypothetical protein GJR95_18840 [Spirosoma endbachense]